MTTWLLYGSSEEDTKADRSSLALRAIVEDMVLKKALEQELKVVVYGSAAGGRHIGVSGTATQIAQLAAQMALQGVCGFDLRCTTHSEAKFLKNSMERYYNNGLFFSFHDDDCTQVTYFKFFK